MFNHFPKIKLVATILAFALAIGTTKCKTGPTIRIPTKPPERHLKKPVTLIREGDFVQASQLLEKLKERYTNTTHIHRINFLLGRSYFELGNFKEAIPLFKDAADNLDLLRDYSLYYLANSHFELGQYEMAIKFFHQLIKEEPESVLRKSSDWYIAQSLFEKGDFKEADKHLTKIVSKYPSSDWKDKALYLEARAKENYGASPVRQLKAFRNLWIEVPYSTYAKEARERDKKLTDKFSSLPKPDVNDYIKAANNQVLQLNYQEALKLYQIALDKLSKTSSSREKRHSLKTIPELYLAIALSYYGMRDSINAIKAFDKVIEIAKEESIVVRALYQKANSYSRLERFDEAIKVYKEVIEKDPDSNFSGYALYKIANLYQEQKNNLKALTTFQTFVEKYPKNPLYKEGLWRVAWNYYLIGRYKEAKDSLENIISTASEEDWPAREIYWKARAYEHLNEYALAVNLYYDLLNKKLFSYYSALSIARLSNISGDFPISNKKFDPGVQISLSPIRLTRKELENPDFPINIRKAKELHSLGFDQDAQDELKALLRKRRMSVEMKVLLSRFFYQLENYHLASSIIQIHLAEKLKTLPFGENRLYWQLAFPKAYEKIVEQLSSDFDLSSYLIYALMRKESIFQTDAISRAGARGLMQIMPSTGKKISENIGRSSFNINELYDPRTNLTFGCWYFKNLIKIFKGDISISLSSYNAGPARVLSWMKTREGYTIDQFIESIPYLETRNYVKSVLRMMMTYQSLYSGRPSKISEKPIPISPDATLPSLKVLDSTDLNLEKDSDIF